MFSSPFRSVARRKCGYVCLAYQLRGCDPSPTAKRLASTTTTTTNGPVTPPPSSLKPWVVGTGDLGPSPGNLQVKAPVFASSAQTPTPDAQHDTQSDKQDESNGQASRKDGHGAVDKPYSWNQSHLDQLARFGTILRKAHLDFTKSTATPTSDVSLGTLLERMPVINEKRPRGPTERWRRRRTVKLMEQIKGVWSERPVGDVINDLSRLSPAQVFGKKDDRAIKLFQDLQRLGLVAIPSEGQASKEATSLGPITEPNDSSRQEPLASESSEASQKSRAVKVATSNMAGAAKKSRGPKRSPSAVRSSQNDIETKTAALASAEDAPATIGSTTATLALRAGKKLALDRRRASKSGRSEPKGSLRRIVSRLRIRAVNSTVPEDDGHPTPTQRAIEKGQLALARAVLHYPPRHLEKGHLSGGPSASTTKNSEPDLPRLALYHPANVKSLTGSSLSLAPLEVEVPSVPSLCHDLSRVLFNPGVYQLQDPRSRVYNFDPYLQNIMPVSEFDFNSLKDYITSSKDTTLRDLALKHGKKYIGSSSSMTSVLVQFHFLLSQWRKINTSMVSRGFPDQLTSFTTIQRAPTAVFLRYQDGVYAIDADKEYDSTSVLMNLGKSMEKLLTLPPEEFERYRRTSNFKISKEEQDAPEAYHYSTSGDFLMRSQLDAHDPRLPGTGMFDLKTRAVVSIRMDTRNYEQGLGYQIKSQYGGFESYEREYFDMIRSAFLKYSLQVRMGRMDGIFVAFHNVEQIFGFQYISLPEMDATLHGQTDTTLGDREFKLSIGLWNEILNRATSKFPGRTLRLHFETRDATIPFMYVFAKPVTEEQMHAIQHKNREQVEEYEHRVLGMEPKQRPTTDQTASPERRVENQSQNLISTHARVEGNSSQGVSATDDSRNRSRAPQPVQPSGSGGSFFKSIASFLTGRETSAPENQKGQREDAVGKRADLDSEKAADPTCTSRPDIVPGITAEFQSEQLAEPTNTIGDVAGAKSLEEAMLGPTETATGPACDELLVMTLTIRNSVNGRYVTRPEGLGAKDDWTVDYDLVEIVKESKKAELYSQSLRRRQKELDATMRGDKDLDHYLQRLWQLSSKGRAWREAQEGLDKARPPVVLYGKPASKSGALS